MPFFFKNKIILIVWVSISNTYTKITQCLCELS